MVTRFAAALPTLFLSHGGGPGFFMKVPPGSMFYDISEDSVACKALKDVGVNREKYGLPAKPDAIVVISAHWEEADAYHVYSPSQPDLFYDYYGFPDHTYELKYPAPGSPDLAQRIVDMINSSELKRKALIDNDREGFDHGVFLPLMILYPEASIPIVQISLDSRLDPKDHIALGKVLAPLRRQNILIVGSGQATHPMGPGCTPQKTDEFINLLQSVLYNDTLTPRDRIAAVPKIWENPLLRQTHIPRSEHLTPLAVVVGAAEGTIGRSLFKDKQDFRFMNNMFSMLCFVFDDAGAVDGGPGTC